MLILFSFFLYTFCLTQTSSERLYLWASSFIFSRTSKTECEGFLEAVSCGNTIWKPFEAFSTQNIKDDLDIETASFSTPIQAYYPIFLPALSEKMSSSQELLTVSNKLNSNQQQYKNTSKTEPLQSKKQTLSITKRIAKLFIFQKYVNKKRYASSMTKGDDHRLSSDILFPGDQRTSLETSVAKEQNKVLVTHPISCATQESLATTLKKKPKPKKKSESFVFRGGGEKLSKFKKFFKYKKLSCLDNSFFKSLSSNNKEKKRRQVSLKREIQRVNRETSEHMAMQKIIGQINEREKLMSEMWKEQQLKDKIMEKEKKRSHNLLDKFYHEGESV
ncbi:uncharacterized protein BX663DRAFT_586938 [Cokeromyces recurvatus]|uniref:uncharacterized protein n=1 Tax=Cokeromyces recurvatus TaxID=90255 RepID=UPI002220F2B9|nr:uncharacterized protein BX663DRAFT_586938 [Cokeromyces recurvatus]KAI7904126.1 hypothetical protein BX663DRAFT_586938 [Cokeromyces recurvatus]